MHRASNTEKESRHIDALALDRLSDDQLLREIRFRINKGMAVMQRVTGGDWIFMMSGRRATSTMNELRAVRNWIKAAIERDAPE